MTQNQHFILSKLNEKRFQKRIYSTREIITMTKLSGQPYLRSGAMKKVLSNHPDWSFQFGRSWMYNGKKSNEIKPVVKKPSFDKPYKSKEISIFWGLIKIKF
jgi:hypothetical protein